MALHSLLCRARSKAPTLGHHTYGCYYLKVLAGLEDEQVALAKRPSIGHMISVRALHADRRFECRCYSNEASIIGVDNGCVPVDSSSQNRIEGNKSQCEPMTGDVNFGSKISARHNLAMIFTCTVCQTRSAKTMSRETYEKGVVIVRCGGCKNLHLIADRLGWFGEPGSVEDFLKQKGVEIRKGTEESYEFSVEDLTGWTPPKKE